MPEIDRAKFEAMEKGQVIDLLLLALQAQMLTTDNLSRVNDLLAAASARISALESANKSQEAELIVLRNRP